MMHVDLLHTNCDPVLEVLKEAPIRIPLEGFVLMIVARWMLPAHKVIQNASFYQPFPLMYHLEACTGCGI